jgi:hypothetical protein
LSATRRRQTTLWRIEYMKISFPSEVRAKQETA